LPYLLDFSAFNLQNNIMTAEQKKQVSIFLNLASAYFRGGYKTSENEYCFTDDEEEKSTELNITEKTEEIIEVKEIEIADSFTNIANEIRVCKQCQLHRTRTQAVVGEGVKRPLVLVIGEGPGADEDASGRPFVGKAGQLLDKMLASINLSRDRNCFIVNIVKCRPPGNRDPLPEESFACSNFLKRQIKILKPLMILCVGRIASQNLLNTSEGITKLRGNFKEYAGFPVLPTYHPSALLRDESLKRFAWDDLKKLRSKLIEMDKHYALEIEHRN